MKTDVVQDDVTEAVRKHGHSKVSKCNKTTNIWKHLCEEQVRGHVCDENPERDHPSINVQNVPV